MKPKFDPTKRHRLPHELQSDSRTIRYDLETLVGIALDYSPDWARTDIIRNNVYVEAFAVHCRALVFFFYGHMQEIATLHESERFSPVRDNDVIACDFCSSWEQGCPSPNWALAVAKRQTDKHVVHITIERRDVNQPGSSKSSAWELEYATSVICDVMNAFLALAPRQNFDDDAFVKMKNDVSKWQSRSYRQVESFSASPQRSFQAKTEARTVSPNVGVNIHAKTG
jgi:hypothetical protein